MRRITTLALLSAWMALPSCITRPVLEPWPCERIAEVDGLHEELLALREIDEMLGIAAISNRTRHYVVESDAKCAADRALMGDPVEEERQPSWWSRLLGWFRKVIP